MLTGYIMKTRVSFAPVLSAFSLKIKVWINQLEGIVRGRIMNIQAYVYAVINGANKAIFWLS